MHGDHRGDIQGLRALAVLLVVLHHAAVGPFHGGYVGVDVFFVVSGFLITSLLIREAGATGRVSVRDFYARRARRILPAAMLVITATVVLSAMVLDGATAVLVGEDALWATFFAANVRFALESTDYFAADQAVSPLQHYWSLAVEEQFYLVWPLLLLAALALLARRLRRRPRPAEVARVVGVLAAVATLVSFAWSLHATASSPLSAYFSTPARAWELGVGALVAVAAPRLARLGATTRTAGSWLGLALIAVAALSLSLSPGTAFPGWAALLPVLGSALLLTGGLGEQQAWGPQRGLTLRPVRAVGDWSYSVYLWHFPLVVLATATFGEIGGWSGVAVVTVTLVLSALTYHLVETPFRTSARLVRPGGGRRRSLLLYPAMLLVVLPTVAAADHAVRADLTGGGAAISTTDYGQEPGAEPVRLGRDPAIALVKASVLAARNGVEVPAGLDPHPLELRDSVPDLGDCDYWGVAVDDLELCERGDAEGDRTLVLLGDSHARQWIPAVEQIAAAHGFRAYYLVLQACPAVAQTPWNAAGDEPREACLAFRDWAVAQVQELEPDLTLLATDVDPLGYVGPDGEQVTDDDEVAAMAESGIAEMIGRLAPSSGRVAVIGDPPQRTVNPNDCLTVDEPTLEGCLAPPDQRSVRMIEAVRAGTLSAGAEFVGVTPYFCYDRVCPTVVGDLVTHRDLEHLTIPYAEHLAPTIADRLGL